MNILILSNAPPEQGSGIVGKELLEGFNKKKSNDARLMVGVWGSFTNKKIIGFKSFATHFFEQLSFLFKGSLRRLKINGPTILQLLDRNYCVQEFDQTKNHYRTKDILRRSGFKPDIIIVLFMPNFISFKNLAELYAETKALIILYFMDMAPMTGGCHYAWDCIGYTKECGFCPALSSDRADDQTHINYLFKKKQLEKTKIFPVAASGWQYKQLELSSLFAKIYKATILLSIDDKRYQPGNKIAVRRLLKVPEDKKIIFFGAVFVNEKRKGFKELIDTLTILAQGISDKSSVHLIIAGNNYEELKNLLPFSYTSLGYLSHDKVPLAFQAADVFISPSIEDSGPMMINQSIMTGTPVVAFSTGVAVDLVHNGKTGYRASLGNSIDLAYGLQQVLALEEKEYNLMQSNCRELGLALCKPENVMVKWEEYFSNISKL